MTSGGLGPDEPGDDENPEFDRFDDLVERLVRTPTDEPELSAQLGQPVQEFDMNCPACDAPVGIAISGYSLPPGRDPFEVKQLPDGRYLIEFAGMVLHVCDYGRGRGGGSDVLARPPDRPPSQSTAAARDRHE